MTTLVGKNGKPLGKPFVIPNLKQQNAPSIKNIPVQVAVSKKKTSGVDNKHIKHDKITTDVKYDGAKHNITVSKHPSQESFTTKEKVEVNSKKVKNDKTSKSSSTKQPQSNIANKNWWDNKISDSNDPILVFSEEQPWFNAYPSFVGEQLQVITDSVKGDDKRYSQVSISISEIYNAEVSRHTKSQGGKGNTDEKWINDVIKSGTLSDKVAALALRVQEAPFYQLETLDLLVAMACKKEQRTSQLALEAIKDLLMNNLLPDRKLTTFKTPLLFHSNMTLSTGLLLWFEGQLKLRIERVMEALDNGLKSNVDYFKKLCLETASSLLMSKPEQEARLLTMIVNKLGDPSSKICSKCIEVLKGVVRVHPAMKLVIVREVRQFIYRPNIKLKSIFNGVIFLSQINLMPGDHLVATQLVECYVSLFEKAVKEDELGSRLLSALLTGINKSFPFLDNIEPIVKYADSLFRLVHTASFTSSTQALMLLSHIAISASSAKDGKKRNKATANKKSVSVDDSMMTEEGEDEEGEDEEGEDEDGETEAEAEDAGSDLMRRYYRALYAKLLSDQVTSRAKNTLLLNLMYRSIKRDPSDHRAMAFLKRLSICATQSSPSIAAGLLFLVSEVLDSRPNLKALLSKTEEASIHTTAAEHLAGVDEEEAHQMLGNFDGSKREPEYAAPARPSLWETALMRRHFHPSVQAFAHSLLESPSHKINFAGDPTTDFSLMAFLNRFAYKNPKKSVADKIQNRRAATQSEEPLNMSKFIRTEETDVAPDKQFFYKFFGEREKLRETGRARDRSKRKKSKRGSDDEDDDDEEDGEEGSVDGDDKKSSKKGSRALDPDEEAEMDAFADKLAEDLMRSADNTYDMDPDMDDFSEDEEDEDEDNSDIDSQGDAEDEDEASEDDSDLDDEDAFGPQESDEEEEDEKPKKGDKKSSKSKSIDSKAMDFADFLAEQRQTSKDDAPKSKKTKSKKDQLQSESEDSDDGYSGLQAYDEAMDEDLAPKKKGEKKTPAAAAAPKKDKKSTVSTAAKKVSAKEQEDMEAMEFDEDGNADWSDLEEDDESESSPPMKKGKAAAKKTNKRDKLAAQDSDDSYDEDAEFDLMLGEDSAGGNKKSNKKANSKRKRKGGDDGGDFASAEDYEEEMDAILQQIQQHNAGGGESLQVGKGGAKKAFGSKKSRK